MVRASIIIVEYNTVRHMPRCLASLERLVISPDEFEVLVVDNGSPTPARPLLQRFPWIRLLETGENLGYAGACNAALAHCRGDAIITLNPDTQVEPDWLHAMLAPFTASDIGAVGCKIYYPNTRILQHAGGIVLPCGRSEHRGRGEIDLGQYDEIADMPYVCGASFAVSRKLIGKIGYFSTVFHPAYYDDTDFCFRAWRAGYRVVYTPHAVISHEEWAASDSAAMTAFRLSEVSRVRYIARNYSIPEVLLRFIPEELAFELAPDRTLVERSVTLRAYLQGVLSAFKERPIPPAMIRN